MIGFRFGLRPLDDVRPWGDGTLHWFALTDGWYCIDAAGHELLRYAPPPSPGPEPADPEPADPARDQPPEPAPDPFDHYVDYFVVRLWEDLLYLLPDLLAPDASGTTGSSHTLDLGYLRVAPRLRLRRTRTTAADTVTLAWENPPDDPDVRFTAPPAGRTTIPTADFLAAVADLHDNLFTAMDARIRTLETAGLPPGIHIDLAALRREHADRATWLERALARTEFA
ncbi:DUF5984 family protein [Yinghuangia soli]|uniref:DUF5984 family protein n=1 Tax=Yinghuangia soli TaxID=2908204 RepID=A0AA41U5R4_9ACTN|nr:DUF5984 family protein [Yinghuangia soli]MCF2532202.1 DUF5984 family protein [Yinghuangia soli]